ncbi:MucB/RseB C-terminal domain-containing protein [Alcanivorax sp. 1008]|uniref:MucB/RseB C-terminal domain-containing protein n=1 Tax=Alcanivorax sp. 1008 TaxID=2816853 RepID=UPI001DE60686|nr:MucB/RseB C-terminal domain-containing protein [Alcanivorax sp. 1008]MCC1495602.1 MucB/RseB C-terminal domain-containing protein [Alcanivorax sp. 1008]
MWLRSLGAALLCLAVQLAPVRAEEISAPHLLKQMADAARLLEYRGRLLYMHGSEVTTLELLHARIDDREHERLTQLEGALAEVIRRGEHVVCVHADQSITRLVNRSSVTPLGLHERLSNSLPVQYRLQLDGEDRVAGRAAYRMQLLPMDQFRYGYRLWTDQASHLLLKSELVDLSGRALERIEFVSLDLEPGLTVDDFVVPAALKERALDSLDASEPAHGRVQVVTGWLPEGFMEADRDVRLSGGERRPVAAATFSDGLAAFTLFVEEPGEGKPEGVSKIGPTIAISRVIGSAGGDWLVTLVGEVPQLTGERVLADLSLEANSD